ncbi:MAG TPA: NF038122 family metalloprotease, partial [Blastocatellia bacterium]|nr:NF038122 family metalloprotease [Blastocatellia bacterium]
MRGPGLHTIYAREDGVGCRLATREELNTLLKRDPNQRLHVISPIRTFNLSPAETGLTIVLRGTEQLHGFPEAENAFNRAKALWESLIQTPITVIVDVDFGPTRFGQPYPQGVLGSTDSQDLGADGIYPDVRAALIAGASNPQEAAIYNSLPANTIPTDRGDVAFMIGPSSVFRALGFISAVADPDAEQEDFGDPPSIGFNSNFTYDFNPDDGIAPGSIDFDAVAVHELGHVLGFVSNVGLGEISD